MQTALKAPEIAGLLAETLAALAHLRAEELEALADRADAMLTACETLASPAAITRNEHRLLGDLLEATGENLRVLRRARANGAEGNSRWAL